LIYFSILPPELREEEKESRKKLEICSAGGDMNFRP
jgi:hypothetical protein